MRQLLGIGLIILGVILGLYLGVWVMLIGGVIQIAKSIQPEVIATGIAWGVVRIILSSLVGWLSALICIVSGKLLLN